MAEADRVDVFVSYRHREPTMSWVRDELYPRLAERFSVILDERDFVDAADLVDEIETSSERARVTLAIVDETYLDSGFTALECATCTELMIVVRGDVDRLPTAARYHDMRADGSFEPLLEQVDAMIRRVFVLEAEADSQWVEGFLLPALRSANVDASHVHDLAGPGYRGDALDRAIERADRVIVVLSSAYLRGTHDDEGRHLRHFEAKEHVDKTVPLVIERVELPRVYDKRLWIDATERSLWDDALRRICELLDLPAPEAEGPPPCPYPGMKPYGEDGSYPFVGRDPEIAKVLDRLRTRRIATVIGPSGSGKSSLVLAGVLPRIRAEGIDGESDVAIEVIRPTDDPTGALDRLDTVAGTGRVGRLLVVDQFEEAFSGSTEHGPALLDTLVERRSSDPGLHVILTVRADFYGELMGHPLWEALAPTRVEVPPLAGDALRDAIREPAADCGVVIDGALVERLAAETEGQPGLMPFLQEAIRSAWKNVHWRYLTIGAYETDGADDGEFGVRQAIRRQADDALELIKARDRDNGERIARSMLLRLVQFGEGGPHTRRQVAVSQLVGDPPDPAFEIVFEILADPMQRIITVGSRERPDRDEPDDVADLSHEAIIAGWPTFAEWIDTHERVERERRRWVERAGGELLTGGDLAAAELWLSDAHESDAYPDAAVVEFIEGSRATADERARERERAAARRRRLLVGGLVGAVVIAVVMAAMAIFGWWSWRDSQESQRAAEREVDRRVANQLPTSASAYTGGLALQALLVRAADVIEETNLGAIEMLTTVERDPPIARRIDATTDGVGFESAALVDDGTIVIGDGAGEVALFRPGEVGPSETADVGHGVLAMAVKPESTIVAVAGGTVDPDGSEFSGSDGWIDLIDVSEPTLTTHRIALDDDTSPVSAAVFDGERLLVGTWDGTVAAIDASDLDALRVTESVRLDLPPIEGCAVPADDRKVRSLAIDTDRRWIASGSNDCRITIFDPATLEPGPSLLGHTDKVRAVAFVPDSTELLSTGDDRSIRSWDLAVDPAAGTVLISAADGFDSLSGAVEGRVVTMCVSPDGGHVVTAGRDHDVRRWLRDDAGLRLDPFEYVTHSTTVRQVVCPTDRQFASIAGDGFVLWNLDRGNRWGAPLTGDVAGRVESIAVRPDGSGDVAVVRDGVLRVHRAAGVGEPAPPEQDDIVASVTYDRDGQHLATVARNDEGRADQVATYTADTLELVSTTAAEGVGELTALDVVDLDHFAAGMNEGEILVVRDGGRATVSTPHARRVTAIALSPDGRVVVGDIGGTLFCATAAGDFESLELGRTINDIALSDDGTVAVGTADGLIVTYPAALDSDDPSECAPVEWTRSAPPVENDSIVSVDLTRDGEVLAAATSSGSVELWDIPRLRLLGSLALAADDRAQQVALDPDAELLVAAGERSVVAFDVDRDGLRQRLCEIAERNLTPDEEASFLPADGDYREIARCFE